MKAVNKILLEIIFMPHTLLGVCTTCIRKLVRNQAREKSKINVVTKFNEAHRLFGVCTTCQCTLGYRQSSTYPMCDPQPGPK